MYALSIYCVPSHVLDVGDTSERGGELDPVLWTRVPAGERDQEHQQDRGQSGGGRRGSWCSKKGPKETGVTGDHRSSTLKR